MAGADRLPQVVHMDEGGYVVRRPRDVLEARVAVLRLVMPAQLTLSEWVTEYSAAELDLAVRHVWSLTAHEDWYRWTPCSPRSCWAGGGHRAHLWPAAGPGRGVWRGVAFYP